MTIEATSMQDVRAEAAAPPHAGTDSAKDGIHVGTAHTAASPAAVMLFQA
jgi:hypothetical protein